MAVREIERLVRLEVTRDVGRLAVLDLDDRDAVFLDGGEASTSGRPKWETKPTIITAIVAELRASFMIC